jgi:hypothetical protein
VVLALLIFPQVTPMPRGIPSPVANSIIAPSAKAVKRSGSAPWLHRREQAVLAGFS